MSKKNKPKTEDDIKLAKLQHRAIFMSREDASANKSYGYYQFQEELMEIVKEKIRMTIITTQTQIKGKKYQAFAWKWLKHRELDIQDEDFKILLNQIRITSDAIAKTKETRFKDESKVKKHEQENMIAAKNMKSLYRELKFEVFNKPIERVAQSESLSRSELGQYVNEPIHIMGKIADMRVEMSHNGKFINYIKILLKNLQFYPTNPLYGFNEAIQMPDHLWIDISSPSSREHVYQKDDYIIFSGTVCQYESKAWKSGLSITKLKYGVNYAEFEAEGQPVLDDQNKLLDLDFKSRPDDVLTIEKAHKIKGKRYSYRNRASGSIFTKKHK